jgi:hypothetical protein
MIAIAIAVGNAKEFLGDFSQFELATLGQLAVHQFGRVDWIRIQSG